ncbi:uncharacterized protein LOC142528808 isoform X2 [Primulina tabacum]|uniref:uncharacterized protein LOC142528808 isoform X2 n=1 Tax=Primulina tabacum TaxID=48773 RepID=UPI003F59D3ED
MFYMTDSSLGNGYCPPPPEIRDIVDAPPLPMLSFSPLRDKITKYYPLELARPELKLAGAGLMENLIHGVESISSNVFRVQRLQWRKLFSAVMSIGHCGMPFLPMLILSPFTSANKIKKPLLFIHGEEDNNPGTLTMHSDRFFNALKGHGALCRLVILPFESHGYAAGESAMHACPLGNGQMAARILCG